MEGFLEQLKNLTETNEGQISTSHLLAETVRTRAEVPENVEKNKTKNRTCKNQSKSLNKVLHKVTIIHTVEKHIKWPRRWVETYRKWK